MKVNRHNTLSLVFLVSFAVGPLVAHGQESPPTSPFADWTFGLGNWRADGDLLSQSDNRADCRAFAKTADWDNYIYQVKARKMGGAEGFLILFRVKDSEHFYWWNIAGWGNGRHALETRPRTPGFPSVAGRIETGRWYDIKIVVDGPSIKCYLDGQLIHDVTNDEYPTGGIGLGTWSTRSEYKDVSVTTLDGRRLHGATGKEMADAALGELDTFGAELRAEYNAMQAAGTSHDDARWRSLYLRAAALRERARAAHESVERIDLDGEQAVIEHVIVEFPAQKVRAQRLLVELSGERERLESIRQSLAAGKAIDIEGIDQVEAFLARTETLKQEVYVDRCPPVAFIQRDAGGRRGTNATMLARMTGVGSAICVYDPAHPERAAETIFDDPEGFIFDMSPSYDAKTLLFAYKREVGKREDSFHIWEINVDGSGLRQLTSGRFHDVSPVYLPDGRIVFNSTRVESFSLCQDFLAAALHVMDGDGGNLRRLEYNSLCDTTPYVLDDGSILFTRWEYQDKNIFCTEGLWTLNPDGTRLQLYYGNTLTVPNAIYGAKQIPGTRKLIAVMAAHHHPPLGGIALIDRSLGIESTEAMTVLTPEVPYTPTRGSDWRHTNWQPGDILYPWSYTDPWPISRDLFLVSYGGPMQGGPNRYRLYLLDDQGFKTPLYENPTSGCYNPVPLAPRGLPHRVPGQVPPDAAGQGRYFVQDVYQGLLEYGVERGQVTHLRIMSQVPKKYNTEGPRYSDHYPAIGEGTYYVKHNYGTVPVYEDGSAYFTVPAGVELYFQALDADGKEVRRMGTITQITDGETQSCIGCHEPRSMAPPPRPTAVARLRGAPDAITPPSWGAGTVDFARHVQPVLDRYCVECHQGPAPEAGIDLSGDKTRLFNMAFESLVFTPGLVARYHLNPGPTGNFPPLASGSYVSRLTQLIEEEHGEVCVDDEGRRRIYTWIDANVPYYATWDMTRPHSFGGRDTWLDSSVKPLAWFAAFQSAYQAAGLPGEALKTGHREINLTRPEYSGVLLNHLSQSSGGRADDATAVFSSTDDPHYRAVLAAIEQGKDALLLKPRVDMPGAEPIAQERDFGRTF